MMVGGRVNVQPASLAETMMVAVLTVVGEKGVLEEA